MAHKSFQDGLPPTSLPLSPALGRHHTLITTPNYSRSAFLHLCKFAHIVSASAPLTELWPFFINVWSNLPFFSQLPWCLWGVLLPPPHPGMLYASLTCEVSIQYCDYLLGCLDICWDDGPRRQLPFFESLWYPVGEGYHCWPRKSFSY